MSTKANTNRQIMAHHLRRARQSLASDAPGQALRELLPLIKEEEWIPASVCRVAAIAAIRTDDLDLSRDLVIHGLELEPTDISLRILSMRLDYFDGDDDGAARFGHTLFAHGVRRLAFMLGYAEALFAQGQFDEALDVLVEALARHPMNPDVRTRLAHVAMEVENGDVGIKAMNALLQPPLLLQARLFAKTEQWRDAVDAYDYIMLRPEPVLGDDVSNITIAGIELERIHALEQLGDCTRLLALAQTEMKAVMLRPEIRLRLADAMLQMGLPTTAIQLVFPCRQDRDFTEATMAVMSVAATLAQRPTLAHRCVQRIRTANRTKTLVPTWERGLWGELVIDQQSSIKAGSDPSGSMLMPLLNAAAHVLDDAIDESPEYADHYFNRANCLAQLGLHVEAKHDLLKALELNPRYTDADRLLKEINDAA